MASKVKDEAAEVHVELEVAVEVQAGSAVCSVFEVGINSSRERKSYHTLLYLLVHETSSSEEKNKNAALFRNLAGPGHFLANKLGGWGVPASPPICPSKSRSLAGLGTFSGTWLIERQTR